MKTIIQLTYFLIGSVLLSSCAGMYLSQGKEDFGNLKYQAAIQSLERSVEKKPSAEASAYLAQAYSITNQPIAAVYEFEKIKNDPIFDDKMKLVYASNLLSANKYKEALEIADGILSRDPGNQAAQSIKISANRVDKMKRDSSLYQVEMFDAKGIKSAMAATKSPNGYLISGAQENLKVEDDYTGLSFLDLYEMDSLGNTNKLPFSDSKFHDAMGVITADGNTVYFTRSNQTKTNDLAYNSENISHPQIYMSKKSNGTWTSPEKLVFNSQDYIYAHPFLSKDEKTLYFSSNMPGGSGKMDIYSSEWTDSGWGAPKNLGPNINTVGNDAFPTLDSINQTLYFSSDGHQTLGGLDVLFSKNENGNWSAPVHMSYPLNSSADDFNYVPTSEKKGMITSDRSGLDKLYKFEQFYPDLTVDGLVTEAETNEVIPGIQITVKNLTDNTTETFLSDENGKFNIDLLPNKEYELIAEDLNEDQIYFNSSQKISTMGAREDEVFDVNFNLEPIKIVENPNDIKPGEDGTYPIPNIYWDYNKWDVRPDAEPYLQMVTDLLNNNPALKVEIRSHCDSRGSFGFNRNLSKKRAKAVMNYLIEKGIERNRLTSKGIGEKELLNECSDGVSCTEEQHQENRRSEFIVTDKSGNKKKLD